MVLASTRLVLCKRNSMWDHPAATCNPHKLSEGWDWHVDAVSSCLRHSCCHCLITILLQAADVRHSDHQKCGKPSQSPGLGGSVQCNQSAGLQVANGRTVHFRLFGLSQPWTAPQRIQPRPSTLQRVQWRLPSLLQKWEMLQSRCRRSRSLQTRCHRQTRSRAQSNQWAHRLRGRPCSRGEHCRRCSRLTPCLRPQVEPRPRLVQTSTPPTDRGLAWSG